MQVVKHFRWTTSNTYTWCVYRTCKHTFQDVRSVHIMCAMVVIAWNSVCTTTAGNVSHIGTTLLEWISFIKYVMCMLLFCAYGISNVRDKLKCFISNVLTSLIEVNKKCMEWTYIQHDRTNFVKFGQVYFTMALTFQKKNCNHLAWTMYWQLIKLLKLTSHQYLNLSKV